MEVFAFVEGVQSVQALLGGVVQLVREILRAREDVRSLASSIGDLLTVVEKVQFVTDKITAKVRDERGLLKSSLQKLGDELVHALMTVDEAERQVQKQKQRPEVWEVVKALAKKGAAKQKKDIKAICDAIQCDLEELDKALTLDTRLIVGDIQVIAQYNASTGGRIETSVGALHQKVDQLLVIRLQPQSTNVPPIIDKLDRWAFGCLHDKTYVANMRIAKSNSSEFFVPGEEHRQSQTVNDDTVDAVEDGEPRRGAREGGWQVENNCKVQFEIKVQEDCFLYVLTFEKNLPTLTNLELFYPKYAACKNKIDHTRIRKFPDHRRYDTDPASCVLEKDASLREGGLIGQLLVYIVLSGEPLMQDGSKVVDINYIVEQLYEKDNDEPEDLHVKRWLFDVR